jgi:Fe-S oxidoreductase/nitrate reductase gamma subunit
VDDRTITREIFEGIGGTGEVIFYALTALVSVVFFVGLGLRLRKVLRGRAERRFTTRTGALAGLLRGTWAAATNATVRRRDGLAGLLHASIMWGFIVLFVGTAILTIEVDLVRPFLPGLSFFHGPFYLVYSLVLDILGLAMLVGLAGMAVRRARGRPQFDYRRPDLPPGTSDRRPYAVGDWLFLGWLATLGVGGFLVEGARIAAHDFPSFEVVSPVGWLVAALLEGVGLGSAAAGLHTVLWWFHALAALAFVAYFPFAKSIHVFADAANLALRSSLAGRRLPVLAASPLPAAMPALGAPTPTDGHLGLRDLADLTWKQLLDLDACTKCGRCHVACPAAGSGAPLSPRDLILDLRQEADATWSILVPLHERRSDRAYGSDGGRIAGGLIRADTLWSCTTCLACVDACPVGIEHVPLIVGMRRALVDAGEVQPGLQAALTSLAKQGNSFGQSGRTRSRWADGLPFVIRDARRERVDWLWFVGDFGSFDARVARATRLVAGIFEAAGMDFGILHDGERNAGNDVRRAGEEGLFELLVEHNVGQLGRASFRRIVTTDPHTLNTLRHEYPDFGGTYEVYHYSQVLAALLRDGDLRVTTPLGRPVTYHDPCYLARYSDVLQAPREVLAAIGAELVEMPRHGRNTYCCGAGGGRVWLDDSGLAERPSEARIREALGLPGVADFVTACPKDLTMYTAAVAAVGAAQRLAVADIAELVAEAAGLAAEAPIEAAAETASAPALAAAGQGQELAG